jgi:hypothetical protein
MCLALSAGHEKADALQKLSALATWKAAVGMGSGEEDASAADTSAAGNEVDEEARAAGDSSGVGGGTKTGSSSPGDLFLSSGSSAEEPSDNGVNENIQGGDRAKKAVAKGAASISISHKDGRQQLEKQEKRQQVSRQSSQASSRELSPAAVSKEVRHIVRATCLSRDTKAAFAPAAALSTSGASFETMAGGDTQGAGARTPTNVHIEFI